MARAGSGVLAMALAVGIWAAWILIVRATVQPGAIAPLGPLELAVLRYAGPAILLAPVWLRIGVLPRGVARWRLAAMVLGWGAPFPLFAAQGLKTADPALFAALVPGAMPLWVAALSTVFLGARPDWRGRVGLALIVSAVGLALAPAALAGDALTLAAAPWLLAASFSWAVYTVAFRGSGLTPIEATAVVGFWSTLALAPAALVVGVDYANLPTAALAAQVGFHAVMAGVVSVAAFAYGVQALGAQRAAALSALTPVTAAVGGVVVLGEPISGLLAAAIIAATAGVALLNASPGVRPSPAR
ncbi:MAG: DMT family transporter [Rhodobacteraceae bacterium]|nr:MAG: DMT family transporter [Paracoccaceae bacterium]